LLSLQSTVFSTWLIKEIAAASNIKDRSNRSNVLRLLTIIKQKLSNINLNTSYLSGLFMFVGINEFGEEIVEFIEPDIKLDLFYYSCSNKFDTSFVNKYIGTDYSGTIIFANGDDCLGYQFKSGDFVKIFGLNGNLVKRHGKGGFSANRFARIAEESRHLYVVRICDRLRELTLTCTQNNWIFGSDEIVQMILKSSPIKLNYGGFLNFNSSTISNRKHWLEYLDKKENYDSQYKEMLDYLEINPDMLDFDPVNKDTMKYFIEKKHIPNTKLKSNQIPLDITSKYYAKLMIFDYIGVKYYGYDINIFDIGTENQM
jgi:hypothetical protein